MSELDTSNKNGIDLFKFIIAFLVVGIHSLAISPNYNLPFNPQYVFAYSVSFFFVCTGYFLGNKYNKTKDIAVIKNFTIQNIKRYLFWLIIFIPTDIYAILHDESILKGLALYIRGILFCGSTSFSWALWYIFALILASAVIHVCLFLCAKKDNFSLSYLTIASIIFYAVVRIFHKYILINLDGTLWYLYDLTVKELLTQLSYGLVFLSLGLYLTQTRLFSTKHKLLIGILLILASIPLRIYGIHAYRLVGGYGIFFIALSLTFPNKTIWYCFRKMSSYIYFLHMYAIFALKILQPEYMLSFEQTWIVASSLALILSVVWYWMLHTNKFSKLKQYS